MKFIYILISLVSEKHITMMSMCVSVFMDFDYALRPVFMQRIEQNSTES